MWLKRAGNECSSGKNSITDNLTIQLILGVDEIPPDHTRLLAIYALI